MTGFDAQRRAKQRQQIVTHGALNECGPSLLVIDVPVVGDIYNQEDIYNQHEITLLGFLFSFVNYF